MSDVFPVFAKRWYGFKDDQFYWQLFSIHGDEASAKATVQRMIDSQRRHRSRKPDPFSEGRTKEFTYQRNMVL